MPQVDLSDDTWIRATPGAVATVIHDDANWTQWWPGLDLLVDERRGEQGVRWTVRAGDFAGTMEIWLEPAFDGVALHYYLRLDPRDGRQLPRRTSDRLRHAHAVRAKRIFWEVKDRLEAPRR